MSRKKPQPTANRPITSPTGKAQALRPTRPNAGIRVEYNRRLAALVDDMNRSLLYWISANYKANLPALAHDANPIDSLSRAMKNMASQWLRKFDKGAESLATWFAGKTRNYSDLALKKALKDAGFSVEFKLTESMKNTFNAVLSDQVGLIRSIAQQHLAKVETLVFQSAAVGRDLETLTKALKKQFGVTQRRAELIARDQNNKATAVFNRARRLDIGITQARWRHSTAGHKPRPEHVAAGKDDGGKGRVYDVSKGCFLEGVWTWPGHEINCRCYDVPIIPALNN